MRDRVASGHGGVDAATDVVTERRSGVRLLQEVGVVVEDLRDGGAVRVPGREHHRQMRIAFAHLLCVVVLPYSNWETGCVCVSESFENVSEPRCRKASGIGTQANIEASGEGTVQPARAKLSTSASRRPL